VGWGGVGQLSGRGGSRASEADSRFQHITLLAGLEEVVRKEASSSLLYIPILSFQPLFCVYACEPMVVMKKQIQAKHDRCLAFSQ